jgi:hypothetical protein
MSQSSAPLVLTLKLDGHSFDRFNSLRQQHFPPERNFLPAHITLFHALPSQHERSICHTLQEVCSQTSVLPLIFPTLRCLGNGVAIEVESSELLQIHQDLAYCWKHWLTPQDRQRYRSHITIQNKVSPEQARQLYDRLLPEWQLQQGQGEGLLLWYYKGGPWELVQEFGFSQTNNANK